MAASKSGVVILASTAVAAGTTTNSSTVNLTAADGCSMMCQMTNGATAPTLACVATVQISVDNTNFYYYTAQSAGTLVSTTYSYSFDLPAAVLYARMSFSGNTGQSVTCVAQSHTVITL